MYALACTDMYWYVLVHSISDPECQYMYVYLSIYVHIPTDLYACICDIYTYIYCWYTSEYVSYTVLQYMIRTPTYMYVYVRICLPMSSILPWLLQYMHVFQVYTCIYRQWKGGTHVSICQYMPVYMSKYMHIHQSVYVRISRSRCRHAALGHGAVTVASHSPAPARGRCTFAARSLRQVCRAAAHGTSQNSIRSGLRDRTAAASGNL